MEDQDKRTPPDELTLRERDHARGDGGKGCFWRGGSGLFDDGFDGDFGFHRLEFEGEKRDASFRCRVLLQLSDVVRALGGIPGCRIRGFAPKLRREAFAESDHAQIEWTFLGTNGYLVVCGIRDSSVESDSGGGAQMCIFDLRLISLGRYHFGPESHGRQGRLSKQVEI